MDSKDKKKDLLEGRISKTEIQNHKSCCNLLLSIDEAEPLSFHNNYEDCLIGKRDLF